MQESRINIAGEFRVWRESENRHNFDIPEYLWSLLYEHIAAYGEEEVQYLARSVVLPWARLKGRWNKWKAAQDKVANKVATIEDASLGGKTTDMRSKHPPSPHQNQERHFKESSRKKRVTQKVIDGQVSNKEDQKSEQTVNVTRISLSASEIDQCSSQQESRHFTMSHNDSCPLSHNNIPSIELNLPELDGIYTMISKPINRKTAMISSDKLQMELGPGFSIFDIADIFVAITTRMQKGGEYNGFANISDN